MLTSDWATPATASHTKTPLANQPWDVVNRTAHFRASGHLLNDVCRQQCCCVSSSFKLQLSIQDIRPSLQVHNAGLDAVIITHLSTLFASAEPLGRGGVHSV